METVSQTVENQEITQEQISSHEAAMIAKADGAAEASLKKDSDQFTSDDNSEQLLAGKYKTPEDLEKAYKELEAKLGNQNKEEKQVEAPTPTSEEAEKQVTEAGLDFSALNQEYADNGELSADTYKSLESKGIDKATVDAYIAGQEALAQQNVARLQASIGGEAEFNSMVEWAADNLSEAEKATFNKAVSSEDMAEFAIKGLYARYRAEAAPRLLDGSPNGATTTGYQSYKEMTRDMANPLYKTDAAYRKSVEQKIARSKF